MDGRGGGVADAKAPTILEPAWSEALSPTHSRPALVVGKSLSWESAVKCRELSLVFCDDLDGWDGGKEGPRERGYMYTYSQFTSLYSRN